MIYIDSADTVVEIWIPKKYGEGGTVPQDEDYNKGYASGYTDGFEDGYDSGTTDGYASGWTDGYDSGLTDCSGSSCNLEEGRHVSLYTNDLFYAGGSQYFIKNQEGTGPGSINVQPLPGYDGLSNVEIGGFFLAQEALNEGYENGFNQGEQYQKSKLVSGTFRRNGKFTNPDGWSSITINVPQTGYTEEDLDAAFQSGITYQKSLLTSTAITENGRYTSQNGFDDVTVSVDCQYGGYNTLDFTYVTTGDNQTINLFMGEMQNDNQYFYAFYSAITYMEIDGVPTLKDPNDIQLSTPEIPGENSYRLYTHTFASAGNHTVRFMMSRSFSASTQTGTKYPAFELTDLIFCSNSQDKCPVVNANIGAGYEVLKTGVFQGNKTLTAATIPASVTGITWVTFENSTIKQLTCYGTTPPTLGSNVFAGVTTLEHIYVPADSVNAYQTASGWSNYTNIISAI